MKQKCHNPNALVAPWIVIIATLGVLLAGIPYAAGYAETRVTLLSYTINLWKFDQWQHCWLVPVIVGFIVWQKRKLLASLPIAGSWWGLLPLAIGLFLYWAGYRADNYYPGIIAILLILGGSIIWLLGWNWMRELAFPWAFLFFALPLLFLESMLAFRLRLIMSDASVFLLNAIGIQAIQQGTAILSAPNELLALPTGAAFSVDVADPCSGIRSLFALTMVTALYAYFTVKPVWKQWVLFACSIPLAIMGNMARIMMLTLGTIAVGPEIAIGSLEHPSLFHTLAGFFVFIVALGGMILIGTLLTADWPKQIVAFRDFIHRTLNAKTIPERPDPKHPTKTTRPPAEDAY